MTRAQRAQQLWSVLVLAAGSRQILTYDLVARIIGGMRPAIGDWLRPIQQYCSENGLPALTSIVVSEQTGLPGDGFIAAADVPAAQVAVHGFDWLSRNAPSVDDLDAAYSRAPDRR